jgi:hypothetical protein
MDVIIELAPAGGGDSLVYILRRARHVGQDPLGGRHTTSFPRETAEETDLEVVEIVVYSKEEELLSRR